MKKTLRFSSRTEQLASVRSFVRKFLGATSLAEQEAELLVLGIDEACSNIIRHAYKASPDTSDAQPIILCCERSGKQICFKLRDFGETVDTSKLGGRPLERIEPGGLGIFFMRQAFDEVDYQPQDIGTELILRKRVNV